MASLLFLSVASLHFLSIPAASATDKPPPELQSACKATRFPDVCHSSMSVKDGDALGIVVGAVNVTGDGIHKARAMMNEILETSTNENRSRTARICLEVLGNAEYRTHLATHGLPLGKIKDARAWISASLSYQHACEAGLNKSVNDTAKDKEKIAFMGNLTILTSNALSMLYSYDNFGNSTESWKQPQTERDGFWEPESHNVSGLQAVKPSSMSLKPDVTVCNKGCTYATVQAAADAAPENSTKRFVIHIKEGVYKERVRIAQKKNNVVFIGDGMGKTVITESFHVGQPGIITYNSATVGVLGDGFMATNLTIENKAGPDANQAVAFRSDSDLSVIENCEFLGHQDTLYSHSLRQYYRSCHIEGTVDFIFGNSAAIFDNCKLIFRSRNLTNGQGGNNAIAASGRRDPAQTSGFIFHNCLINGTEDHVAEYKANPQVHKNFLGRPWKEYSRTVFINCSLEELVSPDGWLHWTGDFALKTLYFGEYKNKGPGSNPSRRVSWSNQVPDEHVSAYSVHNFIQGDRWITPVSYSVNHWLSVII